jgi:hypothetical protein
MQDAASVTAPGGFPACELHLYGIRRWRAWVLRSLVLECPMLYATKIGDTPAQVNLEASV